MYDAINKTIEGSLGLKFPFFDVRKRIQDSIAKNCWSHKEKVSSFEAIVYGHLD